MEQALDPTTVKLVSTIFGIIFVIITGLLTYFIKKVDKGKDKRINEIEEKTDAQQRQINELEKNTPQYEKIIKMCEDITDIDKRLTRLESIQMSKKEMKEIIDDSISSALDKFENKLLKQGIWKPQRRQDDNK